MKILPSEDENDLDYAFKLMGTEKHVKVIPSRGNNAAINWKTTNQIAENLGVSRHTVLRWVRAGTFQLGLHYRNISFDKKRPTYRFDLEKINQLFEG